MKIKVGKYDVYETGTIVSVDNEFVEIEIDAKSGFFLRLSFLEDKLSAQVNARAQKIEDKGIEIVFTNCNDPLGIGNAKPLPMGTIGEKQLLFNYRIYTLKNSGKHIHYTFLLDERKEGKIG